MTDRLKTNWWTSRDMLDFFAHTRDNDVKVEVRGVLVPIGKVEYDPSTDNYVIHLAHGLDYRVAMARPEAAGDE